MSAPTSSFEMDSLASKVNLVTGDTVLGKDSESANVLVEIPVERLGSPFTWASSDEDSPLSVGLLYTTEASEALRKFTDVILSLKNAPTGSKVIVNIQKETGVNTNVFAGIFMMLPFIDVNEFTSQTALSATFSDNVWEAQRRLQIQLISNDGNFAATGLKVTLSTS